VLQLPPAQPEHLASPPALPEEPLPFVRAAKADICLARSLLLHCGQAGLSFPIDQRLEFIPATPAEKIIKWHTTTSTDSAEFKQQQAN